MQYFKQLNYLPLWSVSLSEKFCRHVRQPFERIGRDKVLDGAPWLSPHVAQQLGRNGPVGSHQVLAVAHRQFAAHIRVQLAVERLDLRPGGGGRLLQAQARPRLNVLLEFIAPLLAGVPETCASTLKVFRCDSLFVYFWNFCNAHLKK